MLKTRVCDLLGIDYPIVQAAMAWVSNAEMVAAVSNAGGLGTLGPNPGATAITRNPQETGDRLREQINKVQSLTSKPFAVNVVVPGPGEEAFSEITAKITIEEHVPVAIVSQGSGRVYTERLKKSGIKVLHVIGTPKHAKSAEAAGVDAVITSGTEGGGHSGFHQLTTLTLVPQVADVVKIPIIAGGGIGDGRGLLAALALGAEGIYMGTRFIAIRECPVHQNWKDLLVQSESTDTVAIKHGRKSAVEATDIQAEMRFGSVRCLVNDYVQKVLDMEEAGKNPDEILDFYMSKPEGYEGKDVSRAMIPAVYGDVVRGGMGTGQVVGLIGDIPAAQELIKRIISQAEGILNSLCSMKTKS
jgi:enoyl-[acyl-carrier protein] reductase II